MLLTTFFISRVLAIVTFVMKLRTNANGSVAFVSGKRWYRIFQHYRGTATFEVGHESGQRFSREVQISDTRQSCNERSDSSFHDAVSAVAGNKTFDEMRYIYIYIYIYIYTHTHTQN